MLRELAEGRGRNREGDYGRIKGEREGRDKKEGSLADLTNGGREGELGKEAMKKERRKKTKNNRGKVEKMQGNIRRIFSKRIIKDKQKLGIM